MHGQPHIRFKQSWCVSNYRYKVHRISKARENKRLEEYSWQHTLALFRGCVLDLTTNLPRFSLAHSCIITTIPMSDSIIWLFLFNQPSPPALESLWFGRSASTPQQNNPHVVIESCANRNLKTRPFGVALAVLEPVNKWHYNAFCSQLQWLQTILNIGGVEGVQGLLTFRPLMSSIVDIPHR